MDASSSVFPVHQSSQHCLELEWTGVSTQQPARPKAPGCPSGAGRAGLRPPPPPREGAQPHCRMWPMQSSAPLWGCMGMERPRVLTLPAPRRAAPKHPARCSGRAAVRCLRPPSLSVALARSLPLHCVPFPSPTLPRPAEEMRFFSLSCPSCKAPWWPMSAGKVHSGEGRVRPCELCAALPGRREPRVQRRLSLPDLFPPQTNPSPVLFSAC